MRRGKKSEFLLERLWWMNPSYRVIHQRCPTKNFLDPMSNFVGNGEGQKSWTRSMSNLVGQWTPTFWIFYRSVVKVEHGGGGSNNIGLRWSLDPPTPCSLGHEGVSKKSVLGRTFWWMTAKGSSLKDVWPKTDSLDPPLLSNFVYFEEWVSDVWINTSVELRARPRFGAWRFDDATVKYLEWLIRRDRRQ